jgi:glycosyltransferase involved in cell wall biosynthesis
MHVLHVIDSLGLGGAERMLVDIANSTVLDGHRVSVCVTRTDVTLSEQLDRRIDLLVLGRRRTVTPLALLHLLRWVRAHAVDVIHVHMRSSAKLVLALRASGLLAVPVVLHDHYGTIEIDRHVPAWFRLGHRFLAHYVGVYEKLQTWAISAGMPRERTSTIANGLALTRLAATSHVDLHRTLGVPPSTLVGVQVATIRRDKAIEVTLEALALARHRDRIHIALIGSVGDHAYAAECRERAEALGVSSSVTFLGGRRDVPELLAGASFGVLSSKTESGPLVLIEYLAAQLPLIATRVGDIGARLEAAGVPGFVPPGDPDALATALDALADLTRAQREARIERGTAALRRGWEIRSIMPRWYEVYRVALEA